MPSFLTPLIKHPAGDFRLVSTRSGAVLADQLVAAFDSESRRTGLLKHASLPRGQALIIAPCSAIHTFFMKFPIDAVFAAKDGRVVKARRAIGPWRISGAWGAYAVVELPAGTVAEIGLEAGDVLAIEPR